MIGYNYIKLYIGSGNVNVWQGDKNEKRSNNNKVNEKFKYHGLKYLFTRNLNVTVSFALRRRDMRIAFSVSAVVVDGVFLAHPSEPTPLGGVKVTELRLVPPPLALRVAELGVHRSLAPVDVKPLVRCYEGCFRPIRFLQTTPRCPVISVPQTVVDLHWLVEWEFHSQVLAVLEHPDWHLVHKEPAHPQHQIFLLKHLTSSFFYFLLTNKYYSSSFSKNISSKDLNLSFPTINVNHISASFYLDFKV